MPDITYNIYIIGIYHALNVRTTYQVHTDIPGTYVYIIIVHTLRTYEVYTGTTVHTACLPV